MSDAVSCTVSCAALCLPTPDSRISWLKWAFRVACPLMRPSSASTSVGGTILRLQASCAVDEWRLPGSSHLLSAAGSSSAAKGAAQSRTAVGAHCAHVAWSVRHAKHCLLAREPELLIEARLGTQSCAGLCLCLPAASRVQLSCFQIGQRRSEWRFTWTKSSASGTWQVRGAGACVRCHTGSGSVPSSCL